MKAKTLVLIYILVMVVILAFLWKYLPMWESLLLGAWALVSFVSGYITSYLIKKKE